MPYNEMYSANNSKVSGKPKNPAPMPGQMKVKGKATNPEPMPGKMKK